MNKHAGSASGCLNRKKRRLIASFHLEQKQIYFKNCKTAKSFIFKINLLPLFNKQLNETSLRVCLENMTASLEKMLTLAFCKILPFLCKGSCESVET